MKKRSAKETIKEAGIPFFKIQGAGNDMIVVFARDLRRMRGAAKSRWMKFVAHRQLGLGADQILEVESLEPLKIQIWNTDGSKAEMCANGGRTFLSLAASQGWFSAADRQVSLAISGNPVMGFRSKAGFGLQVGRPHLFAPEFLRLKKALVPFWRVTVGNPHAVILFSPKKAEKGHFWKAPLDFDFRRVGPLLECHLAFPHKTNVEFVRRWRVGKTEIFAEVEVWERASGATLSCGSGAIAVATVLCELHKKRCCKIKMNEFELRVDFDSEGRATLSGPWALVAQGNFLNPSS